MEILSFTDVFASEKNAPFTIQIKTMTGLFIPLTISPSTTILQLKEQIQKTEHYTPDQQRIVYSGKELSNDKCMKDYSIQPDATLHLIIRLRGGMFHETSSRQDMKPLQCSLWTEIESIEKLLIILKKEQITS